LNITTSTFFNWQVRENQEQLEDESSEPEQKYRATELDDLIAAIEIIIKHPEWGGKKASQYLLREEICYLSPSTINRIKKSFKDKADLDKLNKKAKRYEFIEPNDCWALDFKEFKWGDETLYLCLILDDNSRFIIDWRITAHPTAKFVKELLSKNFRHYGKPKVIKSDSGPQFRDQFKEFLEKWLIEHHVSPYYEPSYNGKVERKNRDIKKIIKEINYESTTLEELFNIIGNAIYEHNHIRPHQSLDGVTPYQKYNGFADEVKAKMEAFKKKEKESKGFKTKKEIVFPGKDKKSKTEGIIVPAHLINNPDKMIGFVKQFI